MGALVTLDLPEDSPMHDLPWIITFGPLGDVDEWEPVVCGPYERGHALSLAEAVVAEEQLMAVVEPMLPAVSADQVRGEIAAARTAARDEAARAEQADLYGDFEDVRDEELADSAARAEHPPQPRAAPSEAELRAGFARIAELLTGEQVGGPEDGGRRPGDRILPGASATSPPTTRGRQVGRPAARSTPDDQVS
ncbi:hypothetical protein GA0070616_3453 [Micromonospora nigra]|uniref:Uncharacterized protein n=1 Tax=Micromonospora nigra TaxID=145857 RepID=A0A1C6SCI9_9ACTN|nr:hypothetical protein GA0070616_3453 [Micromonospora nigra]